jgi:hypothetical protein
MNQCVDVGFGGVILVRENPSFLKKNLPPFRFIYKKFPYRLSWNQIKASVMRRQ